MTEIGSELRALIIRARKDPSRWTGKRKGLSQQELADLVTRTTGVTLSQVWLRQIETGYTQTAKADTLANILATLRIDPLLVRKIGYGDVADSMEATIMLASNVIPARLAATTEQYLMETPGLTEDEKDMLVEALHEIRREEPIGRDLWRRKRA